MITYENYEPGKEKEISELIKKVFDEYVAPDFNEKGIKTFCDFIQPERIRERLSGESIAVVSYQEEINGYIEISKDGKIRLFFVDQRFMGKGIGKELFQKACRIIQKKYPELYQLSVHSSIYAENIYCSLGFTRKGEIQEANGILYIPMEMELIRKYE
jgi:ribosomal protein S18 acetylase RimI-like enzyme